MTDERKERMETLQEMFTNDINYKFDGEERVSFKTFIKKVLSHAEDKYINESYELKYPDFNDFLYSFEVDTIAYAVYKGDLV